MKPFQPSRITKCYTRNISKSTSTPRESLRATHGVWESFEENQGSITATHWVLFSRIGAVILPNRKLA